MFEGEEESTSASLARLAGGQSARLAADAVVIWDTGFFEGNIPAITETLRGMLYTQIDVVGTPTDLHSGSFGGAVENPANALAQIIAALKDRDGRVLVPGFYDDVVDPRRGCPCPTSRRSRSRTGKCSSPDGIPVPPGGGGYTVLGAEVDATDARRQRPVGRVPGRRLQDDHSGPRPRQGQHAAGREPGPGILFPKFGAYVRDGLPARGQVSVQMLGMRQARSGRRSTIRWPRRPRDAIEATFGRPPVFIGAGGSIPVAEMFDHQLGLPVVLMGFTNPDDHAHAPNESMVLANYETGIRTICVLWDLLGERGIN